MDVLMNASIAAASHATRWTGQSGRDLREWLEMIRASGHLIVIDAEVDPEEELSAIAFMAAQKRGRQALLFRNLKGDTGGSSILINILASSKERYALTVGCDPELSTRALISSARDLLKQIGRAHV